MSETPTALDLVLDGWTPEQAAVAAAIEAGEGHGCGAGGAAPVVRDYDDPVIGADELTELDELDDDPEG